MKRAQKKAKVHELTQRLVGGKLSEIATYSDLFEKTHDAIFLVDLETHTVVESNPAARRLLGPEAQAARNLARWATPESRHSLIRNLRSLRKQEVREPAFDMRLEPAGGRECVLEVSASRLKLADYAQVIQVIARDVTAERRAKQELLEANRRLEILSSHDELTTLFNVRHFRQALSIEHERSRRYQKPFSIILCDIDHFKNFNDKNGHLEGDAALRLAALLLKSRARATDVVARYGGEEFVILCPEADGAHAQRLAEDFRHIIEDTKFPHGENQPMGKVTLSLGVASFPIHGKAPEEILRHADEALYASKAAGRNRVTLYQPGMLVPKKKAG